MDICLFDRKTSLGVEYQVPNTGEDFARLARWLKDYQAEKSQTKLISEHMGRYGEHLLRWTTDHGWATCGGKDHGSAAQD